MRIFLTGATGFIGANVLQVLAGAGHEVKCLVMPRDTAWRLQGRLRRCDTIRGHLSRLGEVRDELRDWKPEACLHLAWYAEPQRYLHSPRNLQFVTTSIRLLRMLGAIGCKRFIGIGSCAEYALSDAALAEEARTRPDTIYAASKLSFALLGTAMSRSLDMLFAWARIFYLFGPLEDPRRLVPAAILSLRDGQPFSATSGTQIRDYLYVRDVALGLKTLLESDAVGAFNVCSGKRTTVRAVLRAIGQLMRRPELLRLGALPDRDWEPRCIVGQNRKLRRLGWKPEHDLTQGLAATIGYWNDHGAVNTRGADIDD